MASKSQPVLSTTHSVAVESTPLLTPRYTVFTARQKLAIICAATVASVFSPLSANIYYPALYAIKQELHLTEALVNSTITSYMIFQGLSPMFIASSSDSIGRRPIYVVCFAIYIVANIGLAFQHSFAGLLLLRCVQSSGSSSLVNLAYAVTADVVTSSERGKYMGLANLGPVIGPSAGPVIGGLISRKLGWRWIFIVLAIAGLLMLALLVTLLPETCRSLVGDGSIAPPSVWHQSLWSCFNSRSGKNDHLEEERLAPPRKRVNPLDAARLLWTYPTGCVLVYNGITFAGYYTVTSSLTYSFHDIYGFNEVQIGFAYLNIAIGTLMASLGTGFIVDWNFRRHARKAGIDAARVRGMDPDECRHRGFMVERPRIEVAVPMVFLASLTMLSYGWSMAFEVHPALPLVILFAFSAFTTSAYSCFNVLVLDLGRDAPATATAANNLSRCWLAAAGVIIIMPIIGAIGIGWTFTVLPAVWLALSPMILIISTGSEKEEEAVS